MKRTDKAEKISITLPPDMLGAIKKKVEAGQYASTSEVIREAMRLWQRQEDEYQGRLALIRDRLERSAHSGKPVSVEKAFGQIKKLHKKRMHAGDEKV